MLEYFCLSLVNSNQTAFTAFLSPCIVYSGVRRVRSVFIPSFALCWVRIIVIILYICCTVKPSVFVALGMLNVTCGFFLNYLIPSFVIRWQFGFGCKAIKSHICIKNLLYKDIIFFLYQQCFLMNLLVKIKIMVIVSIKLTTEFSAVCGYIILTISVIA
jgi:hypothetical protein